MSHGRHQLKRLPNCASGFEQLQKLGSSGGDRRLPSRQRLITRLLRRGDRVGKPPVLGAGSGQRRQQENEGERDQRRLGHEPQGKKHQRQAAIDFRRWTSDCGLGASGFGQLGISRVRHQGHNPKESTEHILSFRGPGDRFHMQRVPPEKGGNKQASPDRPGHRPEQQEKQKGIHDVK